MKRVLFCILQALLISTSFLLGYYYPHSQKCSIESDTIIITGKQTAYSQHLEYEYTFKCICEQCESEREHSSSWLISEPCIHCWGTFKSSYNYDLGDKLQLIKIK